MWKWGGQGGLSSSHWTWELQFVEKIVRLACLWHAAQSLSPAGSCNYSSRVLVADMGAIFSAAKMTSDQLACLHCGSVRGCAPLALTQTDRCHWCGCCSFMVHSSINQQSLSSAWRRIAVLNSKKRSKLTAWSKQPSLACAAGPVRLQHFEQDQRWDEMQNYNAMVYTYWSVYSKNFTITQYIMEETRDNIKSAAVAKTLWRGNSRQSLYSIARAFNHSWDHAFRC